MAKPSHYTWFLTSLMFAAMTMCGYHATMLLRMTSWTPWRKAGALFAYAAGLLSVGFAASVWIPVIKPIYTLSFTALAMGWCVLALAVLYVVCDVWRFRRGTALVLLFGQYALTAYFVSHFFAKPPNALAQVLLPSTAHLCSPNLAKFLTDVCVVLELVAVVALWRRFKTSPRHVTRTQHDRRSDAPRELAHELGDLQRPLNLHHASQALTNF